MTQQPYTRPEPVNPPHEDEGIAPPPRLLWFAIILFVYLVISVITAFIVYQTQQRFIALLPVGVVLVVILMAICLISAVAFRKALPRHFPLLLAVIFGFITLAGSIGSVFVFTNFLRPEYQQVVVEEAPFMRAFLPPTPSGGVLPTALPGSGGDISPDDLLGGLPLLGETATPEVTAEATEEPQPTIELTEAAAVIEVEASATLQPTSTLPPTATPTVDPPTATSAPTEAAALAEQPVNAISVSVPDRPATELLGGFTYVKQTWNNCGPANITMALSYYGWQDDQTVAASFLKPDREDKNVTPGEMVSFVNERSGVRAITRIGGDINMIKSFIAAKFPVIIEAGGTVFEGYDWIGHYQTIVGYDDLQGLFYVYDSYLGAGEGAGIQQSYAAVDENWKHFNRTFIVVYEQERELEVRRILGNLADPVQAAEHALSVAQEEARENRQDVFAWFNIGTAYTRLERYEEAAAAYDQALRIGKLPWRIMWYQFGPFEAYYNVGRYDDVMALVNANLTNGAQYVEETYYWQGQVFEAQGDTAAALTAYNRALQHNPRYAAAQAARDALA